MKIRGAKWGSIFFLKEFSWEEIFGSMFWRSRFFLGRNFASKIFREFLASKKSFGERKEYWEEERYGEQKFLRANCYL